jgi:hypothetical protein
MGTAWFGSDEFGCRVVPALSGVFLVGAVFLLGVSAFGPRRALLVALLVALSPVHIFQSQVNRFYSVAALFTGITLLLGAIAAVRSAPRWTALTCVGLVLSVLCHSVLLALYPFLVAGILGTRLAGRHGGVRSALVLLAITGLLLAGFVVFHLLPLVRGWNEGAEWGYSTRHSVLASIHMLGWPVALLAVLGGILLTEGRDPQRFYWLACVSAWAAVSLLLPGMIEYNPRYVFPFALTGVVLAGSAIDVIGDRLRTGMPWAAAGWVIVTLGLGLPSLLSHYVDGSRFDIRAAARYVSEHWEPGDRVVTHSYLTFIHYAPRCEPAFAIPGEANLHEELRRITAAPGRTWFVVTSTGGGPMEPLRGWLLEHAAAREHIEGNRIDDYVNAIDILVVDSREVDHPLGSAVMPR